MPRYGHGRSYLQVAVAAIALGGFSIPASAQSPKDLTAIGKQVVHGNQSRDAANMAQASERLRAPADDESFWFYVGMIAVCGAGVEVVRQARNQMSARYRISHDHGPDDAQDAFAWSAKVGSAALGVDAQPIFVDTRLRAGQEWVAFAPRQAELDPGWRG